MPMQGGAPVHPHDIIREIFRSREIIFRHALAGRKVALPGVPIVSRIAAELPEF